MNSWRSHSCRAGSPHHLPAQIRAVEIALTPDVPSRRDFDAE
jgi:hypothetical protein